MLNENEIRERTHLATLDILCIARLSIAAHQNLIMRHYDAAKKDLKALGELAIKTAELIPEETDE